ncbi:uridine kinase [bacterium]|nr:uridine kinase [bacterium]
MKTPENPEQICSLIKKAASGGPRPFLIAIDGRCGSGKTTLAERLAKLLEANLFHADDFYLRPCQRSEARYREPGGNMDRERLRSEVLEPLQTNRPFAYRPYDCRAQSLAAPVSVQPRPFAVIEGSYSCHPELRHFYAFRIFLTTDPGTQKERIIKRGGPECLPDFQNRWIPLEELYFRSLRPERFCDLLLHT